LGSSAPGPSPNRGASKAGPCRAGGRDTENVGSSFCAGERQGRAAEVLEGRSLQGAPSFAQQQQQQLQQEDGYPRETEEAAPSFSQPSQGGPHSCQTSSKAASNSVPLLPSQPPAFTAMASQAGLVWGGLGDWMRKGVSHAQRLHQMHKARVVMRAVGTPAGNIRASVANDGSREGGGGTVEGDGAAVGALAAATGTAAAPHTSWEVPLDPIASMRAQYEALMRFMLMIQNILDSLATSAERLHALLTWQDPTASVLAVVFFVAAGLCASMMGLPALMAAMVLIDMRPPPLRDPFPVPTENLMRALPSRADHMM